MKVSLLTSRNSPQYSMAAIKPGEVAIITYSPIRELLPGCPVFRFGDQFLFLSRPPLFFDMETIIKFQVRSLAPDETIEITA